MRTEAAACGGALRGDLTLITGSLPQPPPEPVITGRQTALPCPPGTAA